MDKLVPKLNEIEKLNSEFFEKSGKKITEYVSKFPPDPGFFINNDLPKEIIKQIRSVIDVYNAS